MKLMQPFLAVLMIALATSLCCGGIVDGGGNDNGGGSGGGITPEVEQPIGTISLIHTDLESGRDGVLQPVEGSRDFFNRESVFVRNNGKGQIKFTDGSDITLYNSTSAEEVVAQISPPEIRLFLTEQGFQGYVPHGSTFTVDMPNGTQVKILGTQFFVLYDPGNNYTSVGNFDGTVRFTPPNGSEQELAPATMVDIAPGGETFFYELPYDPGTFESAADGAVSALDGMNNLRKEFGQPESGQSPNKPITTVFRTLVKSESDYYIPDLAEYWEVNDTGDVVTFQLFGGILLPNGEPFTASYVRDRLERDFYYYQNGQLKLEPIDDLTIRFYLSDIDFFSVMKDLSVFEFEVQLGPIIN